MTSFGKYPVRSTICLVLAFVLLWSIIKSIDALIIVLSVVNIVAAYPILKDRLTGELK